LIVSEPAHLPVMFDEVLRGLDVRADGMYVDGTYGRGGHARGVLERLGDGGALVVFDRDPAAIDCAKRDLGADSRVTICHASFDQLERFVAPGTAAGVLFDLGVSSPQLDESQRGFSFLRDGPLDMRMDPTQAPSAAEWLAAADESEIARVIATYGEDRFARRIARSIVEARVEQPIITTARLADVVAAAIPARFREPGKHPATRAFQAIRIQINRELELLELGLEAALRVLAVGGRLAVISFHSLEDRIVKRFMRKESDGDPVWRGLPNIPESARPRLALVGKAVRASEREVEANVRARSAVLRVAEKVRA
jgi:16S rRNA (cytosine1402-N4)-methyltransferase